MTYSDAPHATVSTAKLPTNKVGLWALILVVASLVLPIIIALVGFSVAGSLSSPDDLGGGRVLAGGLIAIFFAAVVGLGLDVVGLVLGVVALFRKNRGKVLAIVAIVVGLIPLVVGVGIFALLASNYASNYASAWG